MTTDSMDYFNKLEAIIHGLNEKFPSGNQPFQIITRLCEEAGELAKAVNHFENTGIKNEKYGTPNKNELAKEVQDVIRAALQVAAHYDISEELKASIDASFTKLEQDGLIKNKEF